MSLFMLNVFAKICENVENKNKGGYVSVLVKTRGKVQWRQFSPL